MANIRITSLPSEATPSATDVVAIDGTTTRKATLSAIAAAGRPFASQIEAEAGTSATVAMNPLTTKQAIAAIGATLYASVAQGALANSAVQPGDLATVATTGAYSDLSGTPTLGTAAATASSDYAPAAAALPIAGNAGQVLVKSSSTNYDVAWSATASGSGDMLSSAYDPQGIGTDAFDRANHTGIDDHAPYFSVYAFSATGDGSTDDRTALFNANAAAAAAGAGLLIEPGTFLISSALTLTVPVKFAGGKLKPASGISILITSEIISRATQIFDTSLGGTITGSPRLPDGSAWAEWWGANPVGDCTTGILAALAFLKQRAISGSTGGILQFEQGDYGLSSSATIDFRACKLRGRGYWLSRIYGNGSITMFDVVGNIDGSKASYGFEMTGLRLSGDNSNSQPAAGTILKLSYVQQHIIADNHFDNIYRAIHCFSCEGPMVHAIRGNSFIASNSTPAIAGSFLLYLQGVADTDPAVTTGLCHTYHVTDNRGGGVGIQNGFVLDGFDQVHMTANHVWGCEQACLSITSNGQDGYNFFSNGDTWEAINGGASYAVSIVSSQASNLNTLHFSGGQALNGSNACVYISGTAPNNVKFDSYDFRQLVGNGILVEGGEDIMFTDCSAIDININADGNNHYYMIIGNGGTGPNGIIVDNFVCRKNDFASDGTAGIDVRAGTDVQIGGGRLRNVATGVQMAAAMRDEVTVGLMDVGLRMPTVASATTVVLPLGCEMFHISGTTTVGNIAVQSMHRDRTVSLRLDSGLTVQHSGGGNLRLNGAANFVAAAGSWIHFRCDVDNDLWIETGRTAA